MQRQAGLSADETGRQDMPPGSILGYVKANFALQNNPINIKEDETNHDIQQINQAAYIDNSSTVSDVKSQFNQLKHVGSNESISTTPVKKNSYKNNK